jgi:hypothetical protein
MKKLTQLEAQLLILKFPTPVTDPIFRAYLVAAHQLVLFLGTQWFDRHVFLDFKTKKNGFLIAPDKTNESSLIVLHRVILLAEFLYNLYDTPGFAKYLNTLNKRKDIEASFAELQVARILKLHKIPFRFVGPSYKQGADYDLELILENGKFAPCETKCKLESNDLTENSIFNSLHEILKRKQFPKDSQNIVFVSVSSLQLTGDRFVSPENTKLNLFEDFKEKASKAVERIFLKTSRILEVVFFTDFWTEVKDEKLQMIHTFGGVVLLAAYTNSNSSYAIYHKSLMDYIDDDRVLELIQQQLGYSSEPTTHESEWITINSLVS